MEVKKIDLSEFAHSNFVNKSKLYKHGGYHKAKFLRRHIVDYGSHFFAFLMDLNICLLPVYVWVLEFLLILCGLIPPNFFDLLFYVMYAFLFVVSVLVLGVFTVYTYGQSFGGYLTNMKIVRLNKKEASPLVLIFRQALGYGIPLMVLGYFFQIIGMLVWWGINAICVIVTPHQQTLVDLLFKTALVREPDFEDIDVTDEEEEVEKPKKVKKPLFKKPEAKKPEVKKPEPVVAESTKAPEIKENYSPIDLHLRSNYSDDGQYDVEDLFKQAKEANIETISITDHNCARANAVAERFAPLYGIQYIPGVEIDAKFKNIRVRLLGYYIDWSNPVFDEYERLSLQREKNVSIERTKKFEEFCGIHIDIDSLMPNSRFQTITAHDITNMVFHNKRVRELSFVKKYLDSSSTERQARRKFIKDVFGKNGPCYVEGEYPDIKDVLKAIHDADGIAVLSSWNMDNISDEEIEELMQLGIDGIECFSPRVHEATMAALLKIATTHRAFVTCGSDYHGTKRPRFKMGKCYCPEKALPLVRIMTKALDDSEKSSDESEKVHENEEHTQESKEN